MCSQLLILSRENTAVTLIFDKCDIKTRNKITTFNTFGKEECKSVNASECNYLHFIIQQRCENIRENISNQKMYLNH